MELSYSVNLSKSNSEELILHWGLNINNKGDWIVPNPSFYSSNTASKPFDAMAAQNLFSSSTNDLKFQINSTSKNNITGMSFVFYDPITVKKTFLFLINFNS